MELDFSAQVSSR